MKFALLISLLLCTVYVVGGDGKHDHGAEIEDNEFAEFEDFDDGIEQPKETKSSQRKC